MLRHGAAGIRANQRRGLAGLAAVLGGLALIGGCGQTDRGAGAQGHHPPAEPKAPPYVYLTATDRLQRVEQIFGRVELSTNGKYWLQHWTQPQGGEVFTVWDASGAQPLPGPACSAVELCTAAGLPPGSALVVRLNDEGWILFRCAPAGAQAGPTGDFPPTVGAGDWLRFFANTGKAKPLWDGFRVTALAPGARFAIGIPQAPAAAAAPAGAPPTALEDMETAPAAVLLDAQFAVSGGVLRWTPLPGALASLPAAAAVQAIAAVGDDGAIADLDGRMFSAGPAGGFVDRASQRLTKLDQVPGLAPWDGSRWRLLLAPTHGAALTLTEPPQQLPLPPGATRAVTGANRVLVETTTGLVAADARQPEKRNSLPIPVGDNVAPLEPTRVNRRAPGWPSSATVNRHVTGLARAEEHLLVVTETDAAGQALSTIYRWEPLQ